MYEVENIRQAVQGSVKQLDKSRTIILFGSNSYIVITRLSPGLICYYCYATYYVCCDEV